MVAGWSMILQTLMALPEAEREEYLEPDEQVIEDTYTRTHEFGIDGICPECLGGYSQSEVDRYRDQRTALIAVRKHVLACSRWKKMWRA
jgi:hypothetical protein